MEPQRLLWKLLYSGMICILLEGCASPLSSGVRKEATSNLSFTEALARPEAFRGVVIIWGGVIMKTVDYPDRTDIFLWETPLDFRDRPKGREYAEGEFIARSSEKLDSNKYTPQRRITIAGEIVGQELGKYSGEPYVYPVVRIREAHLWEEPLQWEWGRIPYYWPGWYSPHQEQFRQPLR